MAPQGLDWKTPTTLSEINVTPLVDVMLVLLIIFMVTAPMLQQGIDVQLPPESGKAQQTTPESLLITVSRNERVYVQGRRVSLNDLEQQLDRVATGPDQEVYLKADQDVSYGFVVKVMSKIRRAGFEQIGLVTEPNP